MKIVRIVGLFFACFLITLSGFAQKEHLTSQKGNSFIGFGGGLPYGGLGLQISNNIGKGFNLFGGLGYQIADVGYNVGFMKDFDSKSATQFYFSAMVGTNAAIKIDGLPESSKTYFGPSLGTGIKINSRSVGGFLNLGLILPVRLMNYKNDLDQLKQDPRITDLTEPWPVLFVLAYNFIL
ncbi:hypothetical protein Q4534_16730 [Cyclobacterium sp. 1_MG-2023]|uniref:hypothetical protein n=1 Tax=Cyclobacterium sp. 1_MG-2023 TaxID=3062681 RepID=UPI0026E2C056|nr:hypothetical protein [Cyclobacterium sp. 1_MG-2023]MDO6439068.1 hypothetical protein [Cyclobacterium sp. 1_MG-2023]